MKMRDDLMARITATVVELVANIVEDIVRDALGKEQKKAVIDQAEINREIERVSKIVAVHEKRTAEAWAKLEAIQARWGRIK